MSLSKRMNPFLKSNNDTGFGATTEGYGGRFINKDGSFNVVREGIPVTEKMSLFNNLLTMPGWEFLLFIFLFFIGINLLFTILYLMLGDNELTGMLAHTAAKRFEEIFFFSAQTFTTVGYGRINPVGTMANVIASSEALSGFLCFAIVTGLLWGRFSKPKAYLRFSEKAVIAPYQDKTGFMFRFTSYKDRHTLTDVEVKVTLGITLPENGKSAFKFFQLPLERSRIDSLVMNWTIVHPIDEQSPIFGFTYDDLKTANAEVYVLVRGFNDVFSNTVLQRTSYRFDEVVFNAKFERMYRESEDGQKTIMELHKLNDYKVLQEKETGKTS